MKKIILRFNLFEIYREINKKLQDERDELQLQVILKIYRIN